MNLQDLPQRHREHRARGEELFFFAKAKKKIPSPRALGEEEGFLAKPSVIFFRRFFSPAKKDFFLLLLLSSSLCLCGFLNGEEQKEPDVFVTADFLYWWTYVDDITSSLDAREVKNPAVKPDLGFKVGVGYLPPHDGWDLFFQITHLHSRAPARTKAEGLVPQWIYPAPGPGQYVDEIVEGHWRLHFALLDLELGHALYLSPTLTLRPHVGLRYAIIRQKYLLTYAGGDLFPGGTDYVSMKNKYIAPGLRLGLDSTWGLGKGWSFYGDWAFSLQQGEVYVHVAQKVSFEEEKRENIFDCFSMAKPILDLELGLQWETSLSKERYALSLHAGWEMHLFFAQNQLFHFSGSTIGSLRNAHGQLALQGLTLGGRFYF